MTGSNAACGTGAAGATVTGLCCVGAAPVVGAFSALGLGFLVNDVILIPLLVVSLAVAVWGLWRGTRAHGRRAPLIAGAAGSVLALAGIFLWIPATYLGLAAVVAVAFWNAALLHRGGRPAPEGGVGGS